MSHLGLPEAAHTLLAALFSDVPRSIAMKITGHRTEAVYRRYAIVSDADLQAASERLALAARHNFRHNPAERLTGAR
jgi:hypothetical protein